MVIFDGKGQCATCHVPEKGWASAERFTRRADGTVNSRHTPTLYEAAYAAELPVSPDDLAATAWRKSSYSGSSGDNCVEVSDFVTAVAVRDSKDPEGAWLVVDRAAFGTLAARIRAGKYARQ